MESKIVERFEIRQGVFTVPGAFASRVGDGSTVKALGQVYSNGKPFTVWIDLPDGRSVPQMTGLLEEGSNEGSAGATELNLRGRDWMMPLYESMARVERTFGQIKYRELTETCLREAGVPDFALLFDNEQNRAAVQGIPKTEKVQVPYKPSRVVQHLYQARLATQGPLATAVFLATLPKLTTEVTKVVGYDIPNPLKIKPGTTWWSFLQKPLNRAGLFLFAGVDEKTYILTKPNVVQRPTYRIHRRRGDSRDIISSRFRNAATRRFAHYQVLGRSAATKDGSKQVRGESIDQEMVDWGFGFKVWSDDDKDAKTSKQAEWRARRKAAEDRRQGWELSYRYRGLTGPLAGTSGTGGQRAIWAIDSVVEVIDEEYGIEGLFWLESVAMNGAGNDGHTCDLTLHRPADLLFGEEP